jgi:hypothetical protein
VLQSGSHILAETVRTTAQASRLIRSDAIQGHVHPATVIRWILDGIQAGDRRVRLEAVRIGSRWLTSEEALRRFADRLTDGWASGTHYRPAAATNDSLQRV